MVFYGALLNKTSTALPILIKVNSNANREHNQSVNLKKLRISNVWDINHFLTPIKILTIYLVL